MFACIGAITPLLAGGCGDDAPTDGGSSSGTGASSSGVTAPTGTDASATDPDTSAEGETIAGTATSTAGGSTGPDSMCREGSGAPGELCFAPPVEIFGGRPVAALAAADLDDNGADDLVVGHNAGLAVLMGDGEGGFQPAVEIDRGGVVSLALADLDGDGLVDVVAAHGGAAPISFVFGTPGGFAEPEDLPQDDGSPAAPSSVVVADFDGDGRPDIVAVDEAYGRLSLWLQTPTGEFSTPLTLEVGGSPGQLGVGELGGSDAPDVAIPNIGATSVAVLLFADGSFDIAASVIVGDGPRAVAIADLDGDGRDDLAAADGTGDSCSIAFGGAASLGGATSLAAGPGPRAVVVGDMDNDGLGDVAVTLESANALAVFLHDEPGTFLPAQWVATGPSPGAAALADFNGDGLGDIAVGTASAQGGVSLLLSDP